MHFNFFFIFFFSLGESHINMSSPHFSEMKHLDILRIDNKACFKVITVMLPDVLPLCCNIAVLFNVMFLLFINISITLGMCNKCFMNI